MSAFLQPHGECPQQWPPDASTASLRVADLHDAMAAGERRRKPGPRYPDLLLR
jgi:hypothetical protein